MALTDTLVGIGNAIRAKDGTSAPIPLPNMPQRILDIPSGGSGGGGPDTEKNVNFYDPYGRLVHAMTTAEAQALTELPPAPALPGLVFEAWNWSLPDIKQYPLALRVGGTYATASGKTEIDIIKTARTGLSTTLRVNNRVSGGLITIDWGDGTVEDSTSTTSGEKTFTHEYAAYGDYTILLDSTQLYALYGVGASPYNFLNDRNACAEVRVGVRCTRFDNNTFREANNLRHIILPQSFQSFEHHVFRGTRSLRFISVPSNVSAIYYYAFQSASSLQTVVLPNSVTSFNTLTFSECNNMRSIIIPPALDALGASTFQDTPGIVEYIFPGETPPTMGNTNIFSGISGIAKIYVPRGAIPAYQAATNWTAYADMIVALEDREVGVV